ncbi:hypothetical protein JX266_001975 [Neoarthrinium moseri]|nr:hypothetical protein JX266_001975 [Neoarthrinium moseri]
MAAYTLGHHLVGQGLLDAFNFFHDSDPSRGFVNYLDEASAHAQKLVSIDTASRVRLGVDSTNFYNLTDVGRASVRLTTKEAFNHGLFIADFNRMPASTCGTWPAFWALNNADNGIHWPVGGELDIIEGQNDVRSNLFAAHTTAGCSQPASGFSGISTRMDCGPDPMNLGCTYIPPPSDDTSYGDTFNAAGGGVYAMQWEEDGIKIWHWSRDMIPDDIKFAPGLTPDPETWGTPQAIFGGSNCDTDTYFYDLSLAININFCGDYAGNLWASNPRCSALAPTCKEYVADNPLAFTQTYWEINYIEVWNRPGSGPDSTTGSNSTAPPFPTNSTIPSTTRMVTLSTVDTTAIPTGANGGLIDPESIGDYTLLGCFGSTGGYQTFEATADLPDMNNDACVAACATDGKKFAGTFETTCYCADTLGDSLATDNGRCDHRCPGSALQTCGGVVGPAGPGGNVTIPPFNSTGANDTASILVRTHHNRRAAPATILLTLYGNITGEVAPPAPGIGGGNPAATTTALGNTTVSNMVTITTAVTVKYTTICATNPATLVKLQYCTTLTIEKYGCSKTPGSSALFPNATGIAPIAAVAPAQTLVPMVTLTETCKACGVRGENTVTLTVPQAVATGGPEVVVTAFATALVIPLNVSAAAAANVSAKASQMPVMAGADGLGVGGVIGWGVMVWLGVFGIMVAL